jgi:hypothetical protein
MKKIKILLFAVAILFSTSFIISSCAVVPSPIGPVGLFVDVTAPMPATTTLLNATGFSKTGKAEATNILGLIQTGDCSITEAMKAGGITRVHHVDMQITNVLMLYAKKITIVYGE